MPLRTPRTFARGSVIALASLALACAHTPPAAAPAPTASHAEPSSPPSTDCAWPRDADDAAFVRWVLEAHELCADAFAESFRAAVPIERVESMRGPLTASLGAITSVDVDDGRGHARFERGALPVAIARDESRRARGLFFGPPEGLQVSVQDAAAQLVALPGDVSVLITRDGQTLYEHDADAPRAVGSAFKLAVLAALRQAVERGRGPWRAGWARVVELDPAWRSLPSGQLQDWAPGSPVTVGTLATLMISQSDNTATDALIALLGRDAVEAVAPARVRPFVTTRELFLLKDPRHPERLVRFRGGDEAARRALLVELAREPLPDVAAFARQEPSVDVEWHFTAREICALLDDLHALPAMRANPGIAARDAWREIAFKGGSEPGVLSLHTRVVDDEGHAHCVSVTWNGDATVSLDRLAPLYGTTLGALRADAPGQVSTP